MNLNTKERTVYLAEKLAGEGDLSDGELLELIRDRRPQNVCASWRGR